MGALRPDTFPPYRFVAPQHEPSHFCPSRRHTLVKNDPSRIYGVQKTPPLSPSRTRLRTSRNNACLVCTHAECVTALREIHAAGRKEFRNLERNCIKTMQAIYHTALLGRVTCWLLRPKEELRRGDSCSGTAEAEEGGDCRVGRLSRGSHVRSLASRSGSRTS